MDDKNFKVVKIIDEHKIVINGGTKDDIHLGDQLEIYVPGKNVSDPDTQEDLGNLDPIKAYIEVHHIYPKMSVCVNAEYEPASTALAALSNMTSKLTKEVPSAFLVNPNNISGGWLEDDERYINVGDLVRMKRS